MNRDSVITVYIISFVLSPESESCPLLASHVNVGKLLRLSVLQSLPL